jgi:hypothetical protein
VAIQKAQAPWYATNKQVCASCHHQYQPAIAYRVARDHGISLDEAIARADATKTFDFTDIDKAIQYTYVIEPAADDAYRRVAANAAGVKRMETTLDEAIRLLYQEAQTVLADYPKKKKA